jgi:hypothetical protein
MGHHIELMEATIRAFEPFANLKQSRYVLLPTLSIVSNSE